MSTSGEYEQWIKEYNWAELRELWTQIRTSDTPGWEAGKALEYLILRTFELEGAEVVYPYSVESEGVELEQIDGVVYSDGLACLVECKDTINRVNIEPVAKMRNQLLRRPSVTIGLVFSRGGFTASAITLAQFVAPQTILLWIDSEIDYGIRGQCMRRSLMRKYRHCIEQGLPTYLVTEN